MARRQAEVDRRRRAGQGRAGACRGRRAGARPKPPTYTEVFGNALVAEVRRDRRVVGITAAMNSGTGLNILQEAEPEHYFDVGIAEQQAVLFAAGLALEGAKPVCAIYSTFLQRAFDQIVHDVALQKLNVVFAMDRAGLVGDDGPTHHGVFDIAYLRCLPNMTLMAPRDEAMLDAHAAHRAALGRRARSACATRAARATASPLPADPQPIEVGTGEILREGQHVALLGYGIGRRQGARGRGRCSRRRAIEATVADARFAKPLDGALLAQLCSRARAARDDRGGRAAGRLRLGASGSTSATPAIAAPRILRVGLPDRYVTHGKPALLHTEVGFTGRAIARRVCAALGVGDEVARGLSA